MKWKKFGKIALMVLTVAFIAQAGMRLWWPPPEKARAGTWSVTLDANWNGNAQHNINPTAQFCTGGQVPFGNVVAMNDNVVQWDWYNESMNDGGAPPVYFLFKWDYDPDVLDVDLIWTVNGQEVNPITGVFVLANSSGSILNIDMEDD